MRNLLVSFRRRWLLTLILTVSVCVNPVWAESITEGFTTSTGYGSVLTALPVGWGVSGTMSSFERETEKFHHAKPAIAINSNTDNYLITPMLSGEVTFWLRNYTKNYSASATVFVCTEEDDGFVVGEQIGQPLTIARGGTAWNQCKVNVAFGTRLAILLERAVFDDFTYTPAVKQESGIGITAFAATTTAVTTDPEGRYTAAFTATVRNFGDNALTVADNATVSLLNADRQVVATSAPLTIEAGATAVVELSCTGRVNADGPLTFYVKEDLNNQESGQNAQVDVLLFGPRFAIDVAEGTLMDFGFVSDSASCARTYYITNSGNYKLNVQPVAPEGFLVPVVSVPAGSTVPITVSLDMTRPGMKSGTLKLLLNAVDVQTFSLPVSGYVTDTTKMFVTFDDNELPAGWQQGACPWLLADGKAVGTYSLDARSNSEMTAPVLSVADGDQMAVKLKAQSSLAEFTLWYSADNGTTWEKRQYDDELTTDEQLLVFGGIPAGDYLLKFEGYKVAIDAINGFRLDKEAPMLSVSNDKGMAVTSGTTCDFGTVKTSTSMSFMLKNAGLGTLKTHVETSGNFLAVPVEDMELAAGESQEVTITLVVEEPFGPASGTLTLVNEGSEDFVLHLTGTTRDPELLDVDFQSHLFPESWTVSDGATLVEGSWNSQWKDYDYFAKLGDADTLVTQRLKVTEEGQKLVFTARQSSTLWEPTLKVGYTSATVNKEVNWMQAQDLTNGLNTDFRQYEVPLPVGEYYVRFVGSFVCIDDVTGLKIASETKITPANATTGIAVVRAGNEAGNSVFNLQGQRVTEPRSGRLYIINGRKTRK